MSEREVAGLQKCSALSSFTRLSTLLRLGEWRFTITILLSFIIALNAAKKKFAKRLNK